MIFLLNVENYLNIITVYLDFEVDKFIKGQYILYFSPYGHNTLVVVPYDIFLGEIQWLWYRMTYC
jgi:hypothetical protein